MKTYYIYAGANNTLYKIGMTANIEKRKYFLYYKEKTVVFDYIEFKGSLPLALLIESIVRYKLSLSYKHTGLDHFKTKSKNGINANTAKHFVDTAIQAANKALEIAQQIRQGD